MRMPPQCGGRAGDTPCRRVTFATSASSAARDDNGCDCAEAQAPNRLFRLREA